MTEAAKAQFPWRAALLCLAAWLVPSSGHFALGRKARGAVFLTVVACAVTTGYLLSGNLFQVVPGQPLSILATLGSMAVGLPYFALRFALGYEGSAQAATYEYGTIFLLSAGLMNLLLVLDVWDIATGRKE